MAESMLQTDVESMDANKVKYKTIHIVVPKEAEDFNDIFTPEDNYEMIKIGRQKILERKKTTLPVMIGAPPVDQVKELERQIEWMRVELLKYGILCESTRHKQSPHPK